MTYSIVARDADTGHLGVAVQSCWIATGAIVTWARPGVGAVATQSIAEPAYGPRCLEALAAGRSAAEALAEATAVDDMAAVRQVGVIDARGRVASMTGELCIDHAGHIEGDGFAVQANMMGSPGVWPAMAETYTASSGPLAGRLLAALVAAEAAGGDARGVMSAAVLVVDAEPAEPGQGVLVDLRVDRSDTPLDDLAALIDADGALRDSDRAVDELVAGDAAVALATIDAALTVLPGEGNLRFVRAGALAANGRVDDAAAEVRALVAERPSWETVIRSFVTNGLITLPEGLAVDDLFA